MSQFEATGIVIKGLKLYGYHGVMEHESHVGTHFVYDIELEYDFTRGAMTDDLNMTINYASVIDVVKRVNSARSKLIENVAYRLVETLRSEFKGIKSIKIRVTKLNPPIPDIEAEGVSVYICD